MLPIAAIGAAVLVAAVAATELTGSDKKPKESVRKEDHPAPLPQSYVVTLIQGRQLSNVESIRNWTF